jgi:hypothetical protein
VEIIGNAILSPSAQGNLNIVAAGSISGLNPDGQTTLNGFTAWVSSTITMSDADPSTIPGIGSPLSYINEVGTSAGALSTSTGLTFSTVTEHFAESGATQGVSLETKNELHADVAGGTLHAGDDTPVQLYAGTGDISGLTLYSPKVTQVVAGQDITDVGLYLQNNNAADFSVVDAGRDIIAYDPNSALRVASSAGTNQNNSSPLTGDIQISGPGALVVLAGRNFNLGSGPANASGPGGTSNGTSTGLTSIGNQRNPNLPFGGASIIVGAGVGPADGLSSSALELTAFEAQVLQPGSALSARYLPQLGQLMGEPTDADPNQVWADFQSLSTKKLGESKDESAQATEKQSQYALDIFYLVLRDAGRDHNDPTSASPNYENGFAAISSLFPGASWQGDITLTSREIKTENGGSISLLAPGGQINVGLAASGAAPVDQGIITVDGGDISIFSKDSVNVGISRIFTLHGGDEIIWSTDGNIDAGASSRTVQSAVPTRVLVDPQSADVQTDLSGLATGGGIGVLETVVGAPPSNIDLIAPSGFVDAGDAGIRVSGNLTIAAVEVLNAGNITVGGKSSGVPTVAAPNIGAITTASSAGAASDQASAAQVAAQRRNQAPEQELPSIYTVEVVGYGGG